MKREAIGHTKMKRLCRKLDIPLWQGVGLMESIWHLTAREAPRGDIGKLSDEDIAIAIDYRGNEQPMIEAMVHCGWFDQSGPFRLVVHDWPEHADDSVHMKLSRNKMYFVRTDGTFVRPKTARLSLKERDAAEKWYDEQDILHAQSNELCAQTGDLSASLSPPCPALAFPSPPLPIPPLPRSTGGLNGSAERLFDELWLAYPTKGRTEKPLSMQYYLEEIRSEETHRLAIAAIKGKWAASEKWQKGFILALPRWLHNRGWEEEPSPGIVTAEPPQYYDSAAEKRKRDEYNQKLIDEHAKRPAS